MDTNTTPDTTHAPRETRAYDAPISADDRWLCEYLRRTRPGLLASMYRADYVPPK